MSKEATNGQSVLISFLGTGKYAQTAYVFNEDTIRCRFVTTVLANALEPDRIVFLATSKARDTNWPGCRDEINGPVQVDCCDIHAGSDENEIWDIFEQICGVVPEGAHVWLDITHGFRSLPLLGFLALAFLRQARDASVEGMYYGAFEAQFADGRTPVFDLSASLALLDWLSAVDRLKHSGDARGVSALLMGKHQELYRDRSKAGALPRHLHGAGKVLGDTSLAFLTGRPHSFLENSRKVPRHLDSARHELDQWLPPFRMLAGQLMGIYAETPTEDLEGTRRMIGSLVEKKLYAQAVPLAREWLVSVAAEWMGAGKANRSSAEHALQQLASPGQYTPRNGLEKRCLKTLKSTPMAPVIREHWAALTDFRNDLQHCGYRENPKPVERLAREAEVLLNHVLKCPLPGNL